MNKTQTFFETPTHPLQRQYEALRAYFYEKKSAKEVADKFGYSENSLYCFASRFRKLLEQQQICERFFAPIAIGRPATQHHSSVDSLIIALRKQYLSVSDIKAVVDTQAANVSETYIFNLLKREGFARLPRRSKSIKSQPQKAACIEAPVAEIFTMEPENFNTTHVGLLCFLPYITTFGIDKIIAASNFPETKTIPKIQSILSFIALKLSNVKRYSADDLWCMDRGAGLFAGLNVLPKAAWFSSYSHRVTREMNINFLKEMHRLWQKKGWLSDTVNLDFVAVPYWGDDNTIENNWSGTRHKALPSILAAIAQEPDSGLITYGDTTVRHNKESNVVVEFLDFYKRASNNDLKYLVFDSKFTTLENLSKLDDNDVKFITIRRRGKKIVEDIEKLAATNWKKIRVRRSDGKTRQIKINDTTISIKAYDDKPIRQIAITGHGKIKPALIITNDFDIKDSEVVEKYAKRWLVEKSISEQTHFFHLNKVSSSMVIKVDFDLTMTILAHNLYRLLADSLEGHQHLTSQSLYEKFICNDGTIAVDGKTIKVQMKKKRNLPLLLTALNQFKATKPSWLESLEIIFEAASNT